jgi:3,4-dihydroxy 2-butanone 4-phosphate synthase/GTP cyclohydrolase II
MEHRRQHERLLDADVAVELPTANGDFRLHAYTQRLGGLHHVALVKGDVTSTPVVPVYVHLKCFAGDVLRSSTCTCSEHLEAALRHIEQTGVGVIVYLTRQQLHSTVCVRVDTPAAANASQEPVLTRQILADLGVGEVELLVGRDEVAPELVRYGMTVVRQRTI